MGRLARSGAVEVTTAATPEQVWRVLSDVTRAGEWSHETRGGEWIDGAVAARPGARFRGRNGRGRMRWTRACEVVTSDEPHVLAWRTVPTRLYPDSTLWLFELEPVDGGTRITQRFEVLKLSAFFDRLFYLVVPAHRDRTEALRGDIQRLGEVAARSGPSTGREATSLGTSA